MGNLWRETSFALMLIKQVVMPRLNLQDCLENWYKIQEKLSENQRRRTFQIENLFS